MTTDPDKGGQRAGGDELLLQYARDGRSVAFDLDEDLYVRPAIYGAAYGFIDRCYIFLTRPADRVIRVRLRTRDAAPTEEALTQLAGEFANELLNQLLRAELHDATAQIRTYYMARAFFGVTGNPTIDALLAELDREEMADDELEIAVPWEHGPQGKGSKGGGDSSG